MASFPEFFANIAHFPKISISKFQLDFVNILQNYAKAQYFARCPEITYPPTLKKLHRRVWEPGGVTEQDLTWRKDNF
jgi:hypothetical protein